MTQAFSSHECDLLAQALEVAREICRQASDVESRDAEQRKAVLTRSILAGFESGERNARRIAIVAAADLEKAAKLPIASTRTSDSAA